MIDIPALIYAEKAKKISRQPCKSNRASALGHWIPEFGGCMRLGVYERTKWQEKELHDVRVQVIFDEGNNQEKVVLRDMAEAGIQAIEQQSSFEWEKYNITGHLDFVVVEDGQGIPGEIKSMAPYIFDSVNSWDDMVHSTYKWIPPYCVQLTLYMLHKNIDRGLFILKNKSNGALKQIEAKLDYDLGELAIKTAEAINVHVAAGTMPDRITDREKCRDCRFKLLCLPEISWDQELTIADDPDYEKRITEYLAIKATADDAKSAWEIIKLRAKASAVNGVLNMICGKYKLTGKTSKANAFLLDVEVI